MGDARSSAPGKFVSKDVPKRVKKLSWFQKHVLCMKVEIHRENYQAYRERKDILDNQREILHKLSGQQAALSPPTLAISYNKWHTDSYDWGAMERCLFVGRTPRDDDDVEDEEEDEEEEEVEEAEGEEDEEEEEEAEDDMEEDEDDDDFV
jgi:TATA-binding protein-associated factor Taf7